MGGLTQKDIRILTAYADSGNRELYWNYLSQLPGADGYGTLALGVVRNDSLPGRVANSYAQEHARTQHDDGSRFPNAVLSERQWEAFGQSLLKQDLVLRQYWSQQQRPDLALNLPGKDVMTAHDRAFEQHRLDPNCWTPRVLLQAALEKSGPQKLEQIWTNMLDNDGAGLPRVGSTSRDAITQMGLSKGSQYLGTLTFHEVTQALGGRSSVDPNVIGGLNSYALYFEKDGKWASVTSGGGHSSLREITNPTRIAELNDAREVRLERQQKATQFHPEDPYRTITRSPLTASADGLPDLKRTPTRLADIGPDHAEYSLLQQVSGHVAGIDARAGRTPDESSERLTASVMVLARQNNLDRADHVLLSAQTADSPAGRNVFVVQGEMNDPAHLRASMPTDVAVQTPVEQSLQRLELASAERQQAQSQRQQQELDNQVREHPAMRLA
ncbi:Smlt3024 family type IV secretion system effector [Stenotrophomonas indicatrix]|uniref:Smlt3024 family type IV secretion system effector n=1 Tax=Stenotrophomonas TaxID=40323 RepID=UPI00249C343D|nr:XVIPCD domain-containing protein [Stenotrophomonas indicatrix]WGV56020.1 hemolysin [Stenotrophomonas indicatrix]